MTATDDRTSASTEIKFHVLGAVQAIRHGEPLNIGGPKQRTVLALLIAELGRAVSTDRLIDATWGDKPLAGDRRRSLQTYVSNLRRVLDGAIVRESGGYRLDVDRSDVDATWFEDEVAAAEALADNPESAADQLRRALAAWRGSPYADMDGRTELEAEIARLNELRQLALEARIDADLEAGNHRQVVVEMEALTEEHPLRERLRGQQMVALFRCGRQAEALRAYQKARTHLAEELGIDPSPELREIEQGILDQDEALLGDTAGSIVRRAILIADIDGKGGLAELGPTDRQHVIDAYGAALDTAVATAAGTVFALRGSAAYASFDTTVDAVAAAEATQRAIGRSGERGPGLRMAIDVGDVESRADGEVAGPPLSRSRGLVAAAWGGQVLLSAEAQTDLSESREAGWQVKALGLHPIQGLGAEIVVYQLVVPGLSDSFPELRPGGMLPGLPREIKALPGYELRGIVGRGSFGVVHRAYQPSVAREVAVKAIRPDLANEPDFIRRFEVEAQLVAGLEHPHIVPLHDFWRDPDGAYLVMRWLQGGSLADQLRRRGPMSLEDAASLVIQLAPALDAAHRAGVIHGDVTPSNVLLDEDGNAYLSDFGIAVGVADPLEGEEPLDASTDIAGLGLLLRDALGREVPEPVAAVLDTATARDVSRRYGSVVGFVAAWEEAVAVQALEVPATVFTPTRNPYKGLAAFQEGDARDFHGRDQLIDELVAAVGQNRLVAVVGPSGIGKSSAVRAGLIPALRRGAVAGSASWLITDMIPGPYPFESLASALLRVADRYTSGIDAELRRDRRGLLRVVERLLPEGHETVLVIDQLEELFTLAAEPGAPALFLDALADVTKDPDSNLRVVLTLRADFFDHPLRHPEFGGLLRNATVLVSAPSPDDLHDIVRRPAEALGVTFEPGLVERIVGDVSGQPAALPLLEFALAELFASRNRDTLSVESYDLGGGVLGALAHRAESVFEQLDENGRETTRQLMLRLVTVSESSDPTRRRVRRSELDHLNVASATMSDVLAAFGTARLLTFDRDPATHGPTVEVAHESMFTQWERLADWIDTHREDVILSRRLATAVGDWEAAHQDPTHLARAGQLAQFETWNESTDLVLSTTENDFLDASRNAENDRIATRRRRRRLITSGFAVAALIALVLATAALIARNDALIARNDAGEKAELARSRELAAAAITNLDRDPELSLLLALEASASSELVPESRSALREALVTHRAILTYEFPPDRSNNEIWGDMSPDGSLLAVSTSLDSLVQVWNIEHNRLAWEFDLGPSYHANQPFFIDEGTHVVVPVYYMEGEPPPPGQAGVYILDSATGTTVQMHETGECGVLAGIRGRSDTYAYGALPPCWVGRFTRLPPADAPTHRIDLETGEATILKGGEGFPFRVFASADESRIVTSSLASQPLRVIDSLTGDEIFALDTPGPGNQVAAISPDGGRIIYNTSLESLEIYDLATETVTSRYHGHSSIWNAWFTDDADRMFSSGPDGTFQLWDPTTGQTLLSVPFGDTVFWSAVTSDLSRAAVFSGGGIVKVFDLGDNVDPSRSTRSIDVDCTIQGYRFRSLEVAGELATIDIFCQEDEALGRAYVFDPRTGEVVMDYLAVDGLGGRFSADGTKLAVQPIEDGVSSAVAIYDIESRSLLQVMEGLCPKDWFENQQPTCREHPEIPFADTPGDFAFSPDGSQLAMVGFMTDSLTVWETATGTMLTNLGEDVVAVDYHPSGTQLLVGMRSDVMVLDTESWAPLARWTTLGEEGQPPADHIAYTGDGNRVVAAINAFWGTADIHVLDSATLERKLFIPEAHDGGVTGMDVSADDGLVATAGTDQSVRVWSLESGELVTAIPVQSSAEINNVAFIDNDERVMITHRNGPITVLTIDDSELLSLARGRITRGFTETECRRYALDPCPNQSDMQDD